MKVGTTTGKMALCSRYAPFFTTTFDLRLLSLSTNQQIYKILFTTCIRIIITARTSTKIRICVLYSGHASPPSERS